MCKRKISLIKYFENSHEISFPIKQCEPGMLGFNEGHGSISVYLDEISDIFASLSIFTWLFVDYR